MVSSGLHDFACIRANRTVPLVWPGTSRHLTESETLRPPSRNLALKGKISSCYGQKPLKPRCGQIGQQCFAIRRSKHWSACLLICKVGQRPARVAGIGFHFSTAHAWLSSSLQTEAGALRGFEDGSPFLHKHKTWISPSLFSSVVFHSQWILLAKHPVATSWGFCLHSLQSPRRRTALILWWCGKCFGHLCAISNMAPQQNAAWPLIEQVVFRALVKTSRPNGSATDGRDILSSRGS